MFVLSLDGNAIVRAVFGPLSLGKEYNSHVFIKFVIKISIKVRNLVHMYGLPSSDGDSSNKVMAVV